MSGILAFLAGAGSGALKGYQMRRDRDADDELKKARTEDRDWQREQRDRERKQNAVQDQLQQNLRAAAQPVAMTEGAGGSVITPAMDNRDAGLPENQNLPNGGLMPVAYRVGAQGYEDRGAAEAAVAQQNSPQAQQQRIMAAYQGAGMPEKAMEVQSKANASELQGMQLSDARWRRGLGSAMHLGHAGLAQFATKSEAGPMAGMNVSLIPSADGKMVQYGVAGADGSLSPIPGLPAFSNDERGVMHAAWLLDKTITPEMRLAYYQGQDDRTQKRDDRKDDLAARTAAAAQAQANSDRDYKLRVAGHQLAASRASGEASAPKGQIVTTADGGVVLVDPRAGTAKPVTDPDGKQIASKMPGQLTPKQIADANGKMQTITTLRMQINNLKQERGKLGMTNQGPIVGRNPLSEGGNNFDGALAALQTTVRQLTRTPGEGAMSDYESRLSSAQLPARTDYASTIDQKIGQLEDLANVIETGYTRMLDGAPGRKKDEAAPARKQAPAGGSPPGRSSPTEKKGSPSIDDLLKKYQ